MAVKMGCVPVSAAMLTPASDTCARVSAMKEYLRITKNMPIVGATSAVMSPAANARIMKS